MPTKIQKFYENQNIFITGGTGFVGKLLIEKLLRCTNCERITVLVRQKKGKTVEERLQQLFEDPLFERLKTERPTYRKRIQCISGDCALENLGLSPGDQTVLIETINVVFHVAATVRFNEDLKQAYHINVRATVDVINLCKKMKQLRSIVHVSTAFTHCHRAKIDECFYDVPTDFEQLSAIMDKLSDQQLKQSTNKIIDKWPNTYTFTKALAEDYIRNETKQNHLPIAIFRPGIIVSTFKEPITGWTDNLYGLNCAIVLTLNGIGRIFHIDGRLNADILPADFCVNAIIAIGWEITTMHDGKMLESPPLPPPVYNYVSSIDNPITWQEIAYLGTLNSLKYPTLKAYGVPYARTINDKNFYQFLKITLHLIPGFFLDLLMRLTGQKTKIMKTYQAFHQYIDLIGDIPFNNDQFISNRNVRQLWNKLEPDDRQLFEFDIASMSWLLFFRSYVKGLRRYILNDPPETLSQAKNKLWWLKNFELLSKFLLNVFVFVVIYYLFVKLFY